MAADHRSLFDQFKELSIEELSASIVSGFGAGSSHELKKLVYEQKMMEQQHEHNKLQIELQHQKNLELVDKQVRWIKFSAFLTAASTIIAAFFGWYLGQKSQERKDKPIKITPQVEIQRTSK